jgi:Exonuclease VII, large subunit
MISTSLKVTYLNCPFSDKDQAKVLGARWDKNIRQWYVPVGIALEPFQKWLPVSVALPQEKLSSPDGIPQYTIRQFIGGLTTIFYELYPTEIWLMGQITKLKARGENIEIQLMDCEKNVDLKNACSITVMAWNDKSSLIITKMEQNGIQLQEGLLINVKIRPKFHQRYHVCGDVLDIDPAATLGEFALLQRQIREKLKKEGIYDKNKLLPKPFDYCRVAAIHPPDASGYHDFKKEADILQKVSLCDFIYFSSSFEGINTENEILTALDLVLEQHSNNPFDAIIIIRGGGARQGLLNLVKESIIRKICLSPVPIMVGLGHADDKLLLDEVANISLDTPSKTIAYIKDVIQSTPRSGYQLEVKVLAGK